MKTSIMLAALVAAGAAASPAFAQDSGYVQVNLGASVAGEVDLGVTVTPDTFKGSSDLETGLFASVAAGGRLSGNVSVEGEIIYFNSDIDTADADVVFGPLNASATGYGGVVNAIYNFSAGSFSPYVGAGLGWGNADYEFAGESEDDPGLIWQVKAGFVVPVSDTMSVDVGYRYLSTPSFEISEGGVSISAESTAHVLTLGARFTF